MTIFAAYLLIVLGVHAAHAQSREPSCPQRVVGGSQISTVPTEPVAVTQTPFGTAWTCAYDKNNSASVIFLADDSGIAGGWGRPIGLVSTIGDCQELNVLRLLAHREQICVEYVSDNAGCELPVPRETWITCFSATGREQGQWSRSRTVMLQRRSVVMTALTGTRYDNCIAKGMPPDNCVEVSFSTTPLANILFLEEGGLCVTDERGNVLALLGGTTGADPKKCLRR